MAGFSRIYCLGGMGGFMGADGLNPLSAQILVGDADRQWLEPRYFDKRFKPIDKIGAIVPESPNHPYMLLDACMAFFSNLFEKCHSLKEVRKQGIGLTRLDFNAKGSEIPKSWNVLRKEAIPIFRNLAIFEAELNLLDLASFKIEG
jgi:hypothetical protein